MCWCGSGLRVAELQRLFDCLGQIVIAYYVLIPIVQIATLGTIRIPQGCRQVNAPAVLNSTAKLQPSDADRKGQQLSTVFDPIDTRRM